MRICSFLPSATEIVFALGLGDSLVGVTYECDFPPEARSKPVVVQTRLAASSSPAEIDRQVNAFLARGESLYRVDVDALKKIQPDLIITQDLCQVCAASPGDFVAAVAELPSSPQVLSLSPQRLADVWEDILRVGSATGRGAEAAALVWRLKQRLAKVEAAVAAGPRRPRIVCLEWLDPPFVAGHWVPEMVSMSGGIDLLGRPGEPGFRTSWDEVLKTEPEVVAIMPCGYDLAQTAEEVRSFGFPAGWQDIPAVLGGRVFAFDASGYFSRPGPRLAAGVELLAHILHPTRAAAPSLPAAVWRCDFHFSLQA